MTADDVPGWDSFNHINLIVAVEERFGIKFKTAELESLRNVAHLTEIILTKTSAIRVPER
jgi:acyl carrier protein